jgi:hypothetical protein
MLNMVGTGRRLFGEQKPGVDATTFQVDNTSDTYYNSPYYLQHKDQVQPVPKPRIDPPRINLSDVVDAPTLQAIQSAKLISFHSVGDTGATKVGRLADEESVADMMAADVQAGGVAAPWFFYHLGDIIYNFGEGQYYYDQFYNPYRAYDRSLAFLAITMVWCLEIPPRPRRLPASKPFYATFALPHRVNPPMRAG